MPHPPRRRRSWLQWLLIVLLLCPAVWALVHVVRGGIEPSPPMWTEANLIPLPESSENAWERIGPWKTLPRLGVEVGSGRGKLMIAAMSPEIADELARPEVVALLARAPEVLACPRFIDPNAWNLEANDSIRLVIWSRWVALSAVVTAKEDPEAAARTLASLFSLSTGCANASRTTFDYLICAGLAERSLELMLDVAALPQGEGNGQVTRALSEALAATPPLSDENALTGQYVMTHGQITSLLEDNKWSAALQTDLHATFAKLDGAFLVDPPEDRCTMLGAWRNPSFLRYVFGYNRLGNSLLSSFGTFDRVHFPRVREAENAVAEQRQVLLSRVEL
jgi:hypothetical protein